MFSVQLETALGSFHVPSQPLSHATEVEFGDPVRDLTRRFFHQLLRLVIILFVLNPFLLKALSGTAS